MCLCELCASIAHSGQKTVTYPLQLELQVVVIYPVGARNQGQICEKSQGF